MTGALKDIVLIDLTMSMCLSPPNTQLACYQASCEGRACYYNKCHCCFRPWLEGQKRHEHQEENCGMTPHEFLSCQTCRVIEIKITFKNVFCWYSCPLDFPLVLCKGKKTKGIVAQTRQTQRQIDTIWLYVRTQSHYDLKHSQFHPSAPRTAQQIIKSSWFQPVLRPFPRFFPRPFPFSNAFKTFTGELSRGPPDYGREERATGANASVGFGGAVGGVDQKTNRQSVSWCFFLGEGIPYKLSMSICFLSGMYMQFFNNSKMGVQPQKLFLSMFFSSVLTGALGISSRISISFWWMPTWPSLPRSIPRCSSTAAPRRGCTARLGVAVGVLKRETVPLGWLFRNVFDFQPY